MPDLPVSKAEGTGGIQLVLVAYYIRTIAEAAALVEDFERAAGLNVDTVVVVANGGGLAEGTVHGRLRVLAAANDAWEFSGWAAGLDWIQPSGGLIILLNDSYRRNWTIEWPGRCVLRTMIEDARRGRIAGWQDSFTRLSRRVNSRIVVTPTSLAPLLRNTIGAAIAACHVRQGTEEPLFDRSDGARLARWMAKQDGRWNQASLATRLPRIFIEHHLFDTVPPQHLSLRPRSWLASQFYSVARKLAGERR